MSQIFLRSSCLWPSSTLVPCTVPALTHCCCGHFLTSAIDHCSCHRIVISTHKLLTSSPMLCMSCLWCWKLCIFIVKSMYKTLPLSEAVLMFTFIDNSCCGCWTRVVVHHYSFFVYLKTFTSPESVLPVWSMHFDSMIDTDWGDYRLMVGIGQLLICFLAERMQNWLAIVSKQQHC